MSISPHAYLSELISRGGSKELGKEIRRIDAACKSSGVRPLYTLAHLARNCGVSYPNLRQMIFDIETEYSDHQMRKKNGRGMRTLRVPSHKLKQVQRYILQNCLPGQPTSDIAFAYTKHRGIVTAASKHIGAKAMVMVDLKDFFDSVDGVSVYKIFQELGYPELLALEMTFLCTYGGAVRISELAGRNPYSFEGSRFLPQGAPTSGALSNLVLRKLDASLQMREVKGWTVTRYADDIAVSSSLPLSRSQCVAIVADVTEMCRASGFSVNQAKTKVLLNKNSYRVLGLAVGSSAVGLPRAYKRNFESEVHGIATFGLAAHSVHRGYGAEIEYIAFLWGHVAFAKGVDATWGQQMSARLKVQNVPYIDVVATMG